MSTISTKAQLAIRSNMKLMGRLMGHFSRSQASILNWIEDNDERLLLPESIAIISEESGLTHDVILEESNEEVPQS